MNGMIGYSGGFSFFGFFFMLLFWAGIILVVIWIVKQFQAQARGVVGEESALEILKKRYAKGEITKKEFEEMKKDLS